MRGQLTKVVKVLVLPLALGVFMGANEGTCIPDDRPTDPTDPTDPTEPNAVCERQFFECLDWGFPRSVCDEELAACWSPTGDDCDDTYFTCLITGWPVDICAAELASCPGLSPCEAEFEECLASGVDPWICDERFWECEFPPEPPPVSPCEDMYGRCLMEHPFPWECEVILIYCEPEEDCDWILDECLSWEETCFELEARTPECFWIEPPPPGCEEVIADVGECWFGVHQCWDRYGSCGSAPPPPPPGPCDDLAAVCLEIDDRCLGIWDLISECPDPANPECAWLFEEYDLCNAESWECFEELNDCYAGADGPR